MGKSKTRTGTVVVVGRRKHPEPLTPAEQRVLQGIRVGGTNAEIAVRLGLSINTVKYHVANMLAKLEIDDRKALAAWRDSGRLSWLRGRAVLLGLAGVASAATIVVIGAVFLAQRAERAPEDQLWWFETKRDAGTANGFHFRELVTGDEQDLDAPAGVMWVAPQWSPDGSRFSALEVRNGDTTAVALHLWAPPAGSPSRRWRPGSGPDQYWWSPNGSYLALASDDLAIVTRDGKVLARTALDIPGVDEYTAGAAWSTDERAFAFLRNGQLTALNRDGSSQRLLLTAVGIDSDLQNFAVGRWLSRTMIEVATAQAAWSLKRLQPGSWVTDSNSLRQGR